jgi:hypothetical protein
VQNLLTILLTRFLGEEESVATVAKVDVRSSTQVEFKHLHERSVQAESTWFRDAFSHYVNDGHRVASNREIALLLCVAQKVQRENATYNHTPGSPSDSDATFIRVRNLLGMEDICAVLVMFGAKIKVGDTPPRFKKVTTGQPQHFTVEVSYGNGEPSIDIVKAGGKPSQYVIPARAPTFRPGRNRIAYKIHDEALATLRSTGATLGTLLVVAGGNLMLNKGIPLLKQVSGITFGANRKPWDTVQAAIMKRWVDNIDRALRSVAPSPFTTPSEGASSTRGGQVMPSFQDLLLLRSTSVDDKDWYVAIRNEYGGFWDHLDAEAEQLSNEGAVGAMQDLTTLAFLQAVCDRSVLSLELDAANIRSLCYRFDRARDLQGILQSILSVIPAYPSGGVTHTFAWSQWFAVVESGTSVLCPRVLAEEKIGTADSRLITILPGSLAKDGAAVTGFFPELHPPQPPHPR